MTKRVLLFGDLMLDTYTMGRAGRISPEAPVPVIQVEREERRPGGAGNVALNLLSMGMEVTLCARVGDDAAGAMLMRVLEEESIETNHLFVEEGYTTSIKNRIIAANQQIVRVDHERVVSSSSALEEKILKQLPALFDGAACLALSDYGKGLLTERLLGTLIPYAKKLGIPVLVDPKGVNFQKYRGATLLKPNFKEALHASGMEEGTPLEKVAEKLLATTEAEYLVVTRSEKGISLFERSGKQSDFGVKAREVKDVTGAGDTVLAALVSSLLNGLHLSEAIPLANAAAGIAIERVGCARVTFKEMARYLLEREVSHKIIDMNHLFVLKEVGWENASLLIVEEEGFTTELMRKIHAHSKEGKRDLILFVRSAREGGEGNAEFLKLLAHVPEVTFIIASDTVFSALMASSPVPTEEIYSTC